MIKATVHMLNMLTSFILVIKWGKSSVLMHGLLTAIPIKYVRFRRF